MALVGITGGIGSGKSTVLAVFRRLGARILDADTAVHELYEPGQRGYRLVLDRWGSAVLQADGHLNRAEIAQRVFQSQAERLWLESVIHPLVKARLLQESDNGPGDLIGAVPLLFETGWETVCRRTVAVWCEPETQRLRLLQRGWSCDEIIRRNALHLTMNEKLGRADFGIINTGTLELLEIQCVRLWHNQLKPQNFHHKEL